LVTGGAQGIGEAAALALAAEGATVIVADLNAEGAEKTAQAIRASGGSADSAIADMGSQDEIKALVASVIEKQGRIDILVNNAAAVHLVARDKNIVETDLAVWDESIRVNLTGAMLASRCTIPHMLEQGGGSIVMVSSMAHRFGSGIHPAYDATKAAVNALVRSIAAEWGQRGIRCNAVAPGLTLSPTVKGHFDAAALAIYEDFTMSPIIGEPRDQAAAILFLASDEARYINGTVIEVDGGMAAVISAIPALRKLG
jgi:NAD(P)-dependent dehydrogenase (short-subunit alcohol dehydrogenase family)